MFFYFNNIPNDLLKRSTTDEDINVIIGENGSGKSSLLSEVANHFSSGTSTVIAIANTIYDKFIKSPRLKLQRTSSGKSLAAKTIKAALINLVNDDLKRMRSVASTLEYIGFDPVVSFQLKGISSNFRDKIIEADLKGEEKENLLYFLNRYSHENVSDRAILRLNFYNESFSDIRNSYFLTLFQYEKQLKALKLISSINLFLSKGGQNIPLLNASSGELTLATTLIYITSIISHGAIILIDEPENSLHPKWQIEYIKRLYELFYFYQPKIIVATHSPLILNGAEIGSHKVKVFKGKAGKFELHENPSTNVEEIYQDFFDITTPENRFISEEIVLKMNLLSENKIDKDEFYSFIREIKNNSYDEKQKEALDGILELGNEIVKEINQ